MPSPGHSRRDFLRGRAALAAAADAIERAIDAQLGPSEPPPPAIDWRIQTLARRAMACEFELRICAAAGDHATAVGLEALDEIDRIEDRLTVYRDHSDLIDLNLRAASNEAVPLDEALFDLLALCDRIHRETAGAFDPTGGPLSRVWGFHRRAGRVPDADELREALARVGWSRVVIDKSARTVHFAAPGTEINANSVGKGYALDRAADVLAGAGVANCLAQGGRSTLVARGDNRTLPAGGWLAGVRDPVDPTRHVAVFTLRNEALSTSGSGTQFFEHEGRRYGHLIDPRTGRPAEGLYSATVIAATGAEADAYSTAAYVLGVEGTAEMCARTPGLGALLLARGEGGTVAAHRFNLDDRADAGAGCTA